MVRVRLPTGDRAWLVLAHEEAREVLGDLNYCKTGRAVGAGPAPTELQQAITNDLLHLDPPDHSRLRRLVAPAFTRRQVDLLVPRIEQLADGVLDDLAGSREVDLVAALSPLPMLVMCDLLGVSHSDPEAFRAWSAVINTGSLAPPADWLDSVVALVAHVRSLIAAKRQSPGEDLLSELIQHRDDGDYLSEDELTSMLTLLLLAGQETTLNLITNAVYVLLVEKPAGLAKLHEDPRLVPAFLEKVLRVECPVQAATPASHAT